MTYTHAQSGSIHVAVAVVLVIVLVGTLGLVFWQNFVQKPSGSPAANQTTSSGSNDTSNSSKSTNSDMITYEPVVEIANKSDTSKLKGAPDSFKTFVAEQLAIVNDPADSGGCKTSIMVSQIYRQSFVAASFGGEGSASGCAGGTAVLYAAKDGQWASVGTTRYGGFECEKLDEFKVPSLIAGDECMDHATGTRNYSQE